MIQALHIALGLVLGLAAGGAHLALVHYRARRATRGATALAMGLYPVGLAVVALPVFAATQISPLCACVTLPGIALVRWRVLRAKRRAMETRAP
jgi:hypothetical protein